MDRPENEEKQPPPAVSQNAGKTEPARDRMEAELLQARAALRRSHDYFTAILSASLDAIITMDHEGKVSDFNPAAERIFGFRRNDVLGKPLAELIIPERLRQRHYEGLACYLAGGGGPVIGRRIEMPALHADQHEFPVELSNARIAEIEPPMFTATLRDITERKRGEEELRAMADSIPNLAWMARPDGHLFWYNRGWYAYTGTTLEQMEGWGWQAVHDPQMLPRVMEEWQASMRTGEPFEMEFPLRGADGVFRWFLTRANPMKDSEGRVIRWFGTNTDVDEVRRTQEALREETRILELLNQTGSSIASKLDLQSLVQTVTDAATKLSGAKFGAFFYNVLNEEGEAYLLYTLSGAPREAFEKFGLPRNTPVFNPTFRGEGVVRSNDITQDPRYGALAPHHGMPKGHLPVRSYLAVPVISRSGEVIGGLFFGHPEPGVFTERTERLIVGVAAQAAIAIDNARLYEAAQKEIAERRQAEEALSRAQEELQRHAAKLETTVAKRTAELREKIGELEAFSYSISHDMRSPLRAMQGYATALLEDHKHNLPEEAQHYLERIHKSAARMDLLIQEVLAYSRVAKEELTLQPVDLEKLIADVCQSYPALQAPKAVITIQGPLPKVLGHEAFLTQVVSNLLGNAVKFVGPDVTPRVTIHGSQSDGSVRVWFEDNGIGIDPVHHKRIFDIFGRVYGDRQFQGTGIGLAIAKKAVERMWGTIGVESELGRGSRFWFTLKNGTMKQA